MLVGKDDTAAFDKEDEDSLGKWKARFVSGEEESEIFANKAQNQQPENPETVALAKEKFWGRIAVISLGVRDSCCTLATTVYRGCVG